MADKNNRENSKIPDTSSSLRNIKYILNIFIVLLIILNIFLVYSFYLHPASEKKYQAMEQPTVKTIQVDVLNGCGVDGVASQFTDILRQKGFDVVEIKNYICFEIPNTIIIDRIGDQNLAHQVAAALEVPHGNVIRQINLDYFVDVSVVIGKDYSSLKSLLSSKEKENY